MKPKSIEDGTANNADSDMAHAHNGFKDTKGDKKDEVKRAEGSGSQMNMRGVFLHVLADALGSVVVIISALIMWQTEWEYKIYVDPALSLLLVCIMMKVGNAALCGWGTPNRNIVLDFDKTSCLFLLLSLSNVTVFVTIDY